MTTCPDRANLRRSFRKTSAKTKLRTAGQKGAAMLKIRHIAFASDHPGKAAEFYKKAFGFRELRRFGLDPDKPDEAPRPSGVFLTDGTLNLAILKFATDQLG